MLRLSRTSTTATVASCVLSIVVLSSAQEPAKPRQGLTALQTKEAVRIAASVPPEIRKKNEPLRKQDTDTRVYVVGVERLSDKNAPNSNDAPTKAVVTTYRYLDDTTVYTTVDLSTGKPIETITAQHMQTPLSDGEFESAKSLAIEKSDEIRALIERFGKRLEVYAQFSQYTPDGENRIHRVVHLLYRVDKRDLSAPRPVVDLTTREVLVPKPEAEPDNGEVRAKKKP